MGKNFSKGRNYAPNHLDLGNWYSRESQEGRISAVYLHLRASQRRSKRPQRTPGGLLVDGLFKDRVGVFRQGIIIESQESGADQVRVVGLTKQLELILQPELEGFFREIGQRHTTLEHAGQETCRYLRQKGLLRADVPQ